MINDRIGSTYEGRRQPSQNPQVVYRPNSEAILSMAFFRQSSNSSQGRDAHLERIYCSERKEKLLNLIPLYLVQILEQIQYFDIHNYGDETASVEGFPGVAVDTKGNVFGLNGESRALKKNRDGYAYVSIKDSLGKTITKSVHSLVLESFVGPRPRGFCARHLNGNRLDNQISNLRWGTFVENSIDKILHETRETSCLGATQIKSGWQVTFQRKYLGVYPTKASASKAYFSKMANYLCDTYELTQLPGLQRNAIAPARSEQGEAA